jgi:hypothetical protein
MFYHRDAHRTDLQQINPEAPVGEQLNYIRLALHVASPEGGLGTYNLSNP